MVFRRGVPARALEVIALVLLLLAAGCSAQPKTAATDSRLVWPPAPQKTRIQFIRSISSDADVGKDTTFTQEVVSFLTGVKPPPNHMVEPMGIAVSDDGQIVYVTDLGQGAIFAFDFGKKKFRKIGPVAWPVGIAMDNGQNIYVVEQRTKSISVFDPDGNRIRSFTDPSLERPTGIAIDRDRGRLYVADTAHTESKEHGVKVFSLDGKLIGKVGKGKGNDKGEFLFPTYLAVDREGNLYVTDSLNCRVQVFSASGEYLRSYGQRGDAWGNFARPKGVAIDSFGNVYVADSDWSNVQIFNQKGQILLFFGGRGPIPGMLKNPTAVAIDKQNHIYVGDYLNHRIEEYQLVNTTAEDSLGTANAGNKDVKPAS